MSGRTARMPRVRPSVSVCAREVDPMDLPLPVATPRGVFLVREGVGPCARLPLGNTPAADHAVECARRHGIGLCDAHGLQVLYVLPGTIRRPVVS